MDADEPPAGEPVEFAIASPPADRGLAALARPIVWCEATEPIRDVARRIGQGRASYALVRSGATLGIVTDHDFRHGWAPAGPRILESWTCAPNACCGGRGSS